MNDQFSLNQSTISRDAGALVLRYIETPQMSRRPEKIDALLEKRMREFMLARRQRRWMEAGK